LSLTHVLFVSSRRCVVRWSTQCTVCKDARDTRTLPVPPGTACCLYVALALSALYTWASL